METFYISESKLLLIKGSFKEIKIRYFNITSNTFDKIKISSEHNTSFIVIPNVNAGDQVLVYFKTETNETFKVITSQAKKPETKIESIMDLFLNEIPDQNTNKVIQNSKKISMRIKKKSILDNDRL